MSALKLIEARGTQTKPGFDPHSITGNIFQDYMLKSEDCWIIYSEQHEFVFENPGHSRMTGLPSSYNCIGRHISEPPSPCYMEAANELISHKNLALKKGQIKTLGIHKIAKTNDWFSYTFEEMKVTEDKRNFVVTHGTPIIHSW